MPNPKEVRDLIRQTHASIRTHQAAGVVSGVLEMYGPHEGFHVAVGSVDFTPLHWVALAVSALGHARDRMLAMPTPDIELAGRIEHALVTIDFEEPGKGDA